MSGWQFWSSLVIITVAVDGLFPAVVASDVDSVVAFRLKQSFSPDDEAAAGWKMRYSRWPSVHRCVQV